MHHTYTNTSLVWFISSITTENLHVGSVQQSINKYFSDGEKKSETPGRSHDALYGLPIEPTNNAVFRAFFASLFVCAETPSMQNDERIGLGGVLN